MNMGTCFFLITILLYGGCIQAAGISAQDQAKYKAMAKLQLQQDLVHKLGLLGVSLIRNNNAILKRDDLDHKAIKKLLKANYKEYKQEVKLLHTQYNQKYINIIGDQAHALRHGFLPSIKKRGF